MKVNLTIPSELKEIKLKDYQKYMKIVSENEDADDFLNIKAVQIFCHTKTDVINGIKLKDFEQILKILNNTLEEKKTFSKRFKMDSKEFGFIPDLENISMGEYIDLSTYISGVDNLHRAMAVMYRPITKRVKDMYLIEKYEGSDKYCDIMKDAPLSVVLGAQVFFYNLANALLKHTLDFLQNKGGMSSQAKQILDENGDGIKAFMHSLDQTCLNLKLCLN